MSAKYLEEDQVALVLDPGEHTGWVVAYWNAASHCATLRGGTAGRNHLEIAELFNVFDPSLVVFERFNLYPGMSKSLSWNAFYPCEAIGVIRYFCMLRNIPVVEQAPSIKKYSGGLQADWTVLRNSISSLNHEITEHTKDAYLHWKYFERMQRALMR